MLRVKPVSIEVVDDQTASARCDEGFLKLRRLTVRTRYADGSASRVYPCDVVSRPDPDAVVAVLYRRAGAKVEVFLKEGVRPPVYLRRAKQMVRPDPDAPVALVEVVAGVLESGDAGDAGLARRAAAEAREEAGVDLPEGAFRTLGEGSFATPGTSDEKVFFCEAEVPAGAVLSKGPLGGDGSAMEEGTRLVAMDLGDAIRRCRDGRIPDMKTEVALLRLAERLGYSAGR